MSSSALRATPLPPWTHLAGRIGSAVLVALLMAAVTLLLGATAYDVRVRAGVSGPDALVLWVWLVVGIRLTQRFLRATMQG